LDAEGGQFLEDFAGHQVITREFLKREVFDYCLHLGSFEALNRAMYRSDRGLASLISIGDEEEWN
jgi:hypothetical protein